MLLCICEFILHSIHTFMPSFNLEKSQVSEAMMIILKEKEK